MKKTFTVLLTILLVISGIFIYQPSSYKVSAKEVENPEPTTLSLTVHCAECGSTEYDYLGEGIHKKTCSKSIVTPVSALKIQSGKFNGIDATWLQSLTTDQKSNIYVELPNTVSAIVSSYTYNGGVMSGAALNGYRLIDIDLSNANNLEEIGSYSFSGNKKIVGKLIFPTSGKLKTIKSNAFSCVTGISGDLTIPNTVEAIETEAFFGASFWNGKLTITENAMYTEILPYTFAATSLKGEIKIPNQVTILGDYAFYNYLGLAHVPDRDYKNEFTSVSWHDNIKVIGDKVFPRYSANNGQDSETKIVQDIVLPKNLESIGNESLWTTFLENSVIKVPQSVTCIKESAFTNMIDLKTIYLENENPNWVATSGNTDGYNIYVGNGITSTSKNLVIVLKNEDVYNKFKAARGNSSSISYEVQLEYIDYLGNLQTTEQKLMYLYNNYTKAKNSRGEDYWYPNSNYKVPTLSNMPLEDSYSQGWVFGSKRNKGYSDAYFGPQVPQDIDFTLYNNRLIEAPGWSYVIETKAYQTPLFPLVETYKDSVYYIKLEKGVENKLNLRELNLYSHPFYSETKEVGKVYFDYFVYDKTRDDLIQEDENHMITIPATRTTNELMSLYYDAYYMTEDGPVKIYSNKGYDTFYGIKLNISYETSTLYDVTFDTKGAELMNRVFKGNDTGITGMEYMNPPVPYKKGATFKEWNTKADGSGTKFVGNTPVTENMTVYAIYDYNTYTITYNDLYTTTTDNPLTFNVDTETIILSKPIGSRTGYVFDGWYDDLGNKVIEIPKGTTENIVLNADWKVGANQTIAINDDKVHITNVYKDGVNEIDSSNSSTLSLEMTENGASATVDYTELEWTIENIAGFETFDPVCKVDEITGKVIGLKSGVAKVTVKLKNGYDALNPETYDTVIVVVPGDINKDGSVKSLDASILSRVAASLGSLEDYVDAANKEYLLDLADMDGNGKITSIDVVIIKRMNAMLIDPSN